MKLFTYETMISDVVNCVARRIALILLLLTPMGVSAYDLEVDGLYYNIDLDNMTATVVKGDNAYEGDIVVPALFVYGSRTFDVTAIGANAFQYCSKVTSVTMNSGINTIGDNAFDRCINMKSVNIPEGVTHIGLGAFQNCTSLEAIEIPGSVEEIGGGAFSGCSALSSVVINEGVKVIGGSAFRYCSSMVSVSIPSTVTEIRQNAFEYCSSLTYAFIPAGVKNISYAAFRECTSLASVDISEGVTKIENYAFEKAGLHKLYIPASVNSIEESFQFCQSLTEVAFADSDEVLKLQSLKWGAMGSYTKSPAFKGAPIASVYIGRRIETSAPHSGTSFLSPNYWSTTEVLKIGKQYVNGESFGSYEKLKEVYVYNTEPGAYGNGFTSKQYVDVTLYVPKGCKEKYMKADGWKKFFNMEEFDPIDIKDDINAVGNIVAEDTFDYANSSECVKVYSFGGKLEYEGPANNISVSDHGIYIVVVKSKSYKILL